MKFISWLTALRERKVIAIGLVIVAFIGGLAAVLPIRAAIDDILRHYHLIEMSQTLPRSTPPAWIKIEPAEVISLEEAQARMDFNILLPSYLPSGFKLARVIEQKPPIIIDPEIMEKSKVTSWINLQYTNEKEFFTIWEVKAVEPLDTIIGEGSSQQIFIKGEPGIWVKGVFMPNEDHSEWVQDDINTVLWEDGDIALGICGSLPIEELIRVAESMR